MMMFFLHFLEIGTVKQRYPSTRISCIFLYLFFFFYWKKEWRTRFLQPSVKMCHHSPKKNSSKSIFVACTIERGKLQSATLAMFSPCTIANYPRKWSSAGMEGDQRRYFSPFVNNGDVNCGRFDRAFERAVTTVTFTRDVSRALRLPPFMTLVNGTSCRVEEKRETRNVSDTR